MDDRVKWIAGLARTSGGPAVGPRGTADGNTAPAGPYAPSYRVCSPTAHR